MINLIIGFFVGSIATFVLLALAGVSKRTDNQSQ